MYPYLRMPFLFLTVIAAAQVAGRPGFSLFHWLLFTALVICLLLAGSTYYGMLDEVNAQQLKTGKGKGFSGWQRDPFTFYAVMKIHRRLYPESRARVICVVAFTGMVAVGVTLIFLGM